MALLDELKQYLIELEYPNIITLNDDQVGDLFCAANLHILLKWFLGQHLSHFDNNESSVEEMCELLAVFGYCVNDEVLPFVKGTLPMAKQMEIFSRMFHNLRLSKQNDNVKEDSFNMTEQISLDEFAKCYHAKVDLLPSFIGKKTYTVEERNERIACLNENLEGLEIEVENLEKLLHKSDETKTNEITEMGNSVEIKTKAANIDELQLAINIDALSGISAQINQKCDTESLEQTNIGFSDEFESTLNELSAQLQQTLQYYDNMKTVQDFQSMEKTNAKEQHPVAVFIRRVLDHNKLT